MKRLVIRLSVLSVVVVLGLIAIAQARHGFQSAQTEEQAAAPVKLPAGAPQPIQVDPLANPLDEPGSPVNPLRGGQALADDDPAPAPKGWGTLPAEVQLEDDDFPEAPITLTQHQQEHYAAMPPSDDQFPTERAVEPAPATGRRQAEPQPLTVAAQDRYAAPPTAVVEEEAYEDDAPEQFAAEDDLPSSPAMMSREPQALAPSATAPPALRAPQPEFEPQPSPAMQSPAIESPQMASAIPQPTAASPDSYPAEIENAPVERFAAPEGARPLAAQPMPTANDGEGVPGPKHLEGVQSAGVTLRKIAPQEMQVGKQCTFEIVVRNNGRTVAKGIELHDVVPRGTTLVNTEPTITHQEGSRLIWDLGDLEAGHETKVLVHLMPTQEGEIGSVASLHLRADASASVVATRPQLALRLSSEPKVLIGEAVQLSIELSNPGSGPATGVMLFENIPAALTHPAGSSLEFEVGTLMPGETRKLQLELTAAQAGMVKNVMIATADANLQVQDAVELEVVAPALAIAVEGPTKRYLERPATYTLSVGNPGTASAKDIELTTYLPKGMKFVKANNAGEYDPQTHSVSWGLAELPAKQSGTVELVAVPVEPGELNLRIEGKADRGLTDEAEQTVQVEGLAAIMFSVADLQDPIELGGETTYEIRVVNQGSKASANIQLTAQLPPGMKPLSASGPTPYEVVGNQVVFSPLGRLAPKADTTYHIKCQAMNPGDQRIVVQVDTDELQTPVTKEESTRVYSDQ